MNNNTAKYSSECTDASKSDKKKAPVFSILDEEEIYLQDQKEGKQQQPIDSSNQPSQPQPQPTINPEQPYFPTNKLIYLNYYKAIFIIAQILDPIETENLLNYKEESHLQFMFLLWSRVRSYLQSASKMLAEVNLNPHSKSQLSNVQAYLYKAKAKFKVYNEMLDEIRAKFREKIRSIFNMKKSVDGKQRFLDGFEELDYTPDEQIQFTYCNYIEIVLNSKEIKNQYFLNHRFKKVLKAYRKICEMTTENINSQKEIRAKFNQFVADQ